MIYEGEIVWTQIASRRYILRQVLTEFIKKDTHKG